MAAEEQESSEKQAQQGGEGAGRSTAMKAAATAAAAGMAALATRKALSGRTSSDGRSSNGAPSRDEIGSTINSALAGSWNAMRDALIPAAENAAGAVGEFLAENGPEVIRERIVPRFISSFNKARGES
jgi:hypothetical protein